MPYLSGGSLAERVAQHGPAPADEVERQARRLLGALASAHRRRHRPPRHQAGQHPVRRAGRAVPGRLRRGAQPRPDPRPHGGRHGGGHPGLHGPRAGPGRARVARHRRVLARAPRCCSRPPATAPTARATPACSWSAPRAARSRRCRRALPASLRKLLPAMLDPRPDRRPAAAALAGAGPDGTCVRARSPGRARPAGARRSCSGLGRGRGAGRRGRRRRPAATTAATPPTSRRRRRRPRATAAARTCPTSPAAASPAPYTDGEACVDDYADYDGDPANGCEAVARRDATAQPLDDESIEANIVPDRRHRHVSRWRSRTTCSCCCDGQVTVTLEAPPGMDLRLEVRDSERHARRGHRRPARRRAWSRSPSTQCGGDDNGELEVVVRAVGSDGWPTPTCSTRRAALTTPRRTPAQRRAPSSASMRASRRSMSPSRSASSRRSDAGGPARSPRTAASLRGGASRGAGRWLDLDRGRRRWGTAPPTRRRRGPAARAPSARRRSRSATRATSAAYDGAARPAPRSAGRSTAPARRHGAARADGRRPAPGR